MKSLNINTQEPEKDQGAGKDTDKIRHEDEAKDKIKNKNGTGNEDKNIKNFKEKDKSLFKSKEIEEHASDVTYYAQWMRSTEALSSADSKVTTIIVNNDYLFIQSNSLTLSFCCSETTQFIHTIET